MEVCSVLDGRRNVNPGLQILGSDDKPKAVPVGYKFIQGLTGGGDVPQIDIVIGKGGLG